MFKIYTSGLEFLKENKDILNKNILDTSFFYTNARKMNGFTRENYLIKVYSNNKALLLCQYYPYNLLLFGDVSLCKEACDVICDHNLFFQAVLTTQNIYKEFYKHYEARMGGSHKVNMSMDIMYLDECADIDTTDVMACTATDKKALYSLCKEFSLEALGRADASGIKSLVDDYYFNFYCVKENDEIVSIARKTREDETICSISYVYTKKKFRSKGYAKKVVGKISKDILFDGKTPYLYVDKNNPISNHTYSSLGYKYGNSKYEVEYMSDSVRSLLVAGGCFWCMAKPYYEYDGVRRVLSGFVGGDTINPTYEDVKAGKTKFKEGILIEYDSNVISSTQLIDIYFDTIDPFDSEGQFIDRGSNYTCAIYSDDQTVIYYSHEVMGKLEEQYNKSARIPVLPNAVFFKAEEYHQDYALKNPELMEEELIKSGRKNK
ncbi:MAG: peptide-methionine (S)-S-oxide reductase MsrA [Erysipelotrichaceae bacterium]|nr:peptide-methionine (S)-S-oxide reductase MsrA [Erysipelotrichaceae bacterium]